MGRIAIALSVAVSVWLGSALAAEAQQITPTGPLSVTAGSTTSTYTANIYLPNPCAYRLRLWIYNGATLAYYSETVVANPGVQNSNFSKVATFSPAVKTGDVLTFKASMRVVTTWYDATDWVVTVTGTRPSKTDAVQKSTTLALQSIDRDRRRE